MIKWTFSSTHVYIYIYQPGGTTDTLKKSAKISLYRVLLYGTELWVTYQHYLQLERLNGSLAIPPAQSWTFTWVTLVTKIEVLEKANTTKSRPCYSILATLSWTRLQDREYLPAQNHAPQQTLASHRGTPKKRFRDCLKKPLVHWRWSTQAENRDTWRLATNHVVSSFEITLRSVSTTKGTGGGSTAQCYQALQLLRKYSRCTTSALSATNVAVGCVNPPLFLIFVSRNKFHIYYIYILYI